MKKALRGARVFAVALLAVALVVIGCAPKEAPPPAPPTIGQFASEGQRVFSTICYTCHGQKGEGAFGPALIGENATLEKFVDAQRLFDYISVAMPLEAPGTLKREEYLQVMSYLLIENRFARPETAFDSARLDQYPLMKR